MNHEIAIQALKTGTTVRGTTEHGRVYEGKLENRYVVVKYRNGMVERTSPVNAPADHAGPVYYTMTIELGRGLVSSVDFTIDQLEEIAPEIEPEAAPVATPKLTSYQLATGHTHIWAPHTIAKRLEQILTHYRHGVWYVAGEGDESVTTYLAILDYHGRALFAYVLET